MNQYYTLDGEELIPKTRMVSVIRAVAFKFVAHLHRPLQPGWKADIEHGEGKQEGVRQPQIHFVCISLLHVELAVERDQAVQLVPFSMF